MSEEEIFDEELPDLPLLPPPFLIVGELGKKTKKVEKIKVGLKEDTFDVYPDKKGRFIADLNNLRNGYNNLPYIFLKIIFKKSGRKRQ